MAQQVKATATISVNLSSVLRTHIMQGKNHPSCPWHARESLPASRPWYTRESPPASCSWHMPAPSPP